MNLNVFNWAYTKRYYFTHPWKWFSELFNNIHEAYRRVKYGWCYSDCWDLDSWFCSVLPPMLRHMADKGHAYPGREPFETPEKWHNWLHKMANVIERLQYDNWLEDNNEYNKSYEQTFEDEEYEEEHPDGPFLTTTYDTSLSKEEVRKAYYERCKEVAKTREQALEDFSKEFFSHFDALWD